MICAFFSRFNRSLLSSHRSDKIDFVIARQASIQPGGVVARYGQTVRRARGEITTEENFPVRLNNDDANDAVSVRVETVCPCRQDSKQLRLRTTEGLEFC